MPETHKPLARTTELSVVDLAQETVIYDLRNDKAHCLNETAAGVWKNCNGKNAPQAIAGVMSRELGALVPDEFVSLALCDLAKAGLLEPVPGATTVTPRGLSRRELVRRTAGIATIALPLVSTLLAPTAASAVTLDCTCVTPGDCLAKTGCPSTANCNPLGVCAP